MSEFVDRIVADVGKTFNCFGGGRSAFGNPISEMLKDGPPLFAAGVDVRRVVEHVIKSLREPTVGVTDGASYQDGLWSRRNIEAFLDDILK